MMNDKSEHGGNRNRKKKRSRHGEGRIYSVNGRWYLRFMFLGTMQPLVTLKTIDGLPCLSRDEAEQARARFMDVFMRREENRIARQDHELKKMSGSAAESCVLIGDMWLKYESILAEREKKNRKVPRPDTRRTYRMAFDAFYEWQKKIGIHYIERVTSCVCDQYEDSLTKRGLSASSVNHHLTALSLLWVTVGSAIGFALNPWSAKAIGRQIVEPPARIGFTVDEARSIFLKSLDAEPIRHMNGSGPAARRCEMPPFFLLLYWTGLRAGDAARLKWENVKFDKERLELVISKTRQFHTIYLHPVLARWLDALPGAKDGYVFPSVAALYNRKSYYLCIHAQKFIKAAGIETTTAPGRAGIRRRVLHGLHSFRHGFATIATEINANLLVAANIVLQHKSKLGSTMTQHYSHLGATAGKDAVLALPDITNGTDPAVLGTL